MIKLYRSDGNDGDVLINLYAPSDRPRASKAPLIFLSALSRVWVLLSIVQINRSID